MNNLFFPVNPGTLTATTLIVMGLASGLPSTANAALRTWNGGGADRNWNTAGNWGGTALAGGDSMTFAGTTRLAPLNNLTAGTSFAGITFASDAGAFTLAGTGAGLNGIALTGSVVNSSANLQTITLPISLAAVQTFNTGAGGLMLGETNNSASGVISGAGGITKEGSGTLTLNAANTYSGGTTISEGTLSIKSANNLGTGSLKFSGASTATPTLYATVDGINLGMNIDQQDRPSHFRVDSGNTLTLSGTISGFSQLRMNGAGTLVLNAANTYSGKTVVNSGTVRLGALGSIIATNFDVLGGNFDLNGKNQSVTTTMTLGTNTSDGVILSSSSASTLTVGVSVAARSGSISVNLAGAGGLTKTTARTVTLSGENTYSGATTVSAGRLIVNGSTSASSAVGVSSSGTLAGSGTVGGNTTIASGGALAPGNSPGVLTIAGTTTFDSGSVFEWELDTAQSNPETNRGIAYDGLNTTSVTGSDAIFKIMLTGTQDFTDTFWNQTRVWTDIFKSADGSTILADWASVFGGGFQYTYNGQSVAPTSQGYFTTSGNSLTWSAVPEPSNLLAGMLAASALLRRRRQR